MRLPNSSWSDQSGNLQDGIKICKISDVSSSTLQPLIITHSLRVHANLTWELFVHGQQVSSTCSALTAIPSTLSSTSFTALLSLVDKLNICAGHPDDHMIELADARKGRLSSAFLDEHAPVQLNRCVYQRTIRASGCELLVHGSKCAVCVHYRSTLRSMLYKHQKHGKTPLISPTRSHCNNRFMHTPQRKKR